RLVWGDAPSTTRCPVCRKEPIMQRPRTRWLSWAALAAALAAPGLAPSRAPSACCYFAAKDKDVLQPAQKAFITWDPAGKVESFTVQPKFEGKALDFGMVIPTRGRPRLDEMPRDFFKELAVYTILKKREHPQSKLLPVLEDRLDRKAGDKSSGGGAVF